MSHAATKANISPIVANPRRNIAGNQTLNQRDGIHPTERGARILADNVWRVLKPIVAAREGNTARD